MYLIFDLSNIALCSPVNRGWKVKLHIWGEVCCAISWDIMQLATETIHHLRKLSRLLQSATEHLMTEFVYILERYSITNN